MRGKPIRSVNGNWQMADARIFSGVWLSRAPLPARCTALRRRAESTLAAHRILRPDIAQADADVLAWRYTHPRAGTPIAGTMRADYSAAADGREAAIHAAAAAAAEMGALMLHAVKA